MTGALPPPLLEIEFFTSWPGSKMKFPEALSNTNKKNELSAQNDAKSILSPGFLISALIL